MIPVIAQHSQTYMSRIGIQLGELLTPNTQSYRLSSSLVLSHLANSWLCRIRDSERACRIDEWTYNVTTMAIVKAAIGVLNAFGSTAIVEIFVIQEKRNTKGDKGLLMSNCTALRITAVRQVTTCSVTTLSYQRLCWAQFLKVFLPSQQHYGTQSSWL